MPNTLANIAILLWPLVTVLLFYRLPINYAVLASLICAYLLLPVDVAFDFPLIPPLDKSSLPALSVFACLILIKRRRVAIFGSNGLVLMMIVTAVAIGPIVTVLNNSQPLLGGRLPGLKPTEVVSLSISTFLMLLPFFIGRQYLATTKDHRALLVFLVVLGLIYTLPVLYEVRMSPQLNKDIYGFFPHSWIQQKRQGGFRAVVFLGHGLMVAFFMATVLIAAVGLWRAKWGIFKRRGFVVMVYLATVLLLCKSLAAAMYGLMLLPVIRFFSKKRQVQVAALLVLIVCTYPLLRTWQLIPTEGIVNTFNGYSADRAGSLAFRFNQEDTLIEKALTKPLFGWGTYGRNRVYDYASGADISVTDGTWVILLGSGGLALYLSLFGLLAIGVFKVYSISRRNSIESISYETVCLSLIVAANMVDLLPNSSLTPLTWLMAGSLLGWAERFRWPINPYSASPQVNSAAAI